MSILELNPGDTIADLELGGCYGAKPAAACQSASRAGNPVAEFLTFPRWLTTV